MKKAINVIWLRRDFRFTDHEAFQAAAKDQVPNLVMASFPQRVQCGPTWDVIHHRFLLEAIRDLQLQGVPVHYFEMEVSEIITDLLSSYHINALYSLTHLQELEQREQDESLQGLLDKLKIPWVQIPQNQSLKRPLIPSVQPMSWLTLAPYLELPSLPPDPLQAFGSKEQALIKLRAHCERINNDELKWNSDTSEISPYISWGILSLQEVYQISSELTEISRHKKSREQFLHRLQWQPIMMEQFEKNPKLEFNHPNPRHELSFDREAKKNFKKWKSANTGEPLIDACLRCVIQTGQLSFKKRSLIVSYLTHQLKVPWQKGALFLARCFLDYHPAIHYPQFWRVMSSTPYNIKSQAKKLDPHGEFQARWSAPLKLEQGDILFDSNPKAPL